MKCIGKKLTALFLSLGMAVSLLGGTAWAAESAWPAEAVEFDSHHYMVYHIGKTWTEAEAYCKTLGGHLATITSAREQEFVRSLSLRSRWNYWLGGTDAETEGVWKWVTNESWVYSNWADGMPDNAQRNTNQPENYLQLCPDWGCKWNDSAQAQDNTASVGFICEWEKVEPAIALNKSSVTVEKNGTCTLKASVEGTDAKVTWKSSNKNVATVDSKGKVMAKKRGKCTITATAGTVSASAQVTVAEKWQIAYGKYLKKQDSNSKFHLAYIDGDNIPELVFCDQISHMATPKTYTFYKGKMKLVSKYGAYASFAYAPKKNRFYTGNLSRGYDTMVVYQMSKGRLKKIADFVNDEGLVGKSKAKYTVNGKNVSKKVYKKKMKEALKGYKYRWAGYTNGFDVNEKNIRVMISKPKAVTY